MSTKKRRRRLVTARHCRQYLADIVHRIDTGELDSTAGGKMIYGISVILKSVELDEIEKRITELEKMTNGQVKTHTYYEN